MILRWTPEPGDAPRELSFKPMQLLSPEAEPIEAAGHGRWETFDQWHRLFLGGHKYAERVALWIARRRDEPALLLGDVVVRMNGLSVHFDADEIRERRQQIRDLPLTEEWTAEMRDTTLGLPYMQLPEGEEDHPLPPSGEPSDSTPTPPAAARTDSTSPGSST